MLEMLLTISWQCAHLVISWVGLVRRGRDLLVLAWVDGDAAAADLACQWPRMPHAQW
jgi:hypothetical protein